MACGLGAVVFLFLLFSNGAGFLWCVGVWGGGSMRELVGLVFSFITHTIKTYARHRLLDGT